MLRLKKKHLAVGIKHRAVSERREKHNAAGLLKYYSCTPFGSHLSPHTGCPRASAFIESRGTPGNVTVHCPLRSPERNALEPCQKCEALSGCAVQAPNFPVFSRPLFYANPLPLAAGEGGSCVSIPAVGGWALRPQRLGAPGERMILTERHPRSCGFWLFYPQRLESKK